MKDLLFSVNAVTRDGTVEKEANDWPISFCYTSHDLNTFIATLSYFCSNDAKKFGEVVTPLVSGMRIRGPFCPKWSFEIPKIVLMDCKGLGHTISITENIPQIPGEITQRYGDSDTIIVVDTAVRPMLSDTQKLVISIITCGYRQNMVFAFTHFDQLTGPNYADDDDKRAHVRNSIRNLASGCEEPELHNRVQNDLDKIEDDRYIYFSNVKDSLSRDDIFNNGPDILSVSEVNYFKKKDLAVRPMNKAVNVVPHLASKKIAIENHKKTNIVHDRKRNIDGSELQKKLLCAVSKFHNDWDAYLNMGSPSAKKAEHWTRIKALTRRIAEFNLDSYDTLQPVAESTAKLRESLYIFLTENIISDSERDRILRKCSSALYNLCRKVIIQDRIPSWKEANAQSGFGSTKDRAKILQKLFRAALPSDQSNKVVKQLLRGVIEIGVHH